MSTTSANAQSRRDGQVDTRAYVGNVSIALNTKGKITLIADPKGKYNAGNAKTLYNKAMALAKEHEAEIDNWAIYDSGDSTAPVAPVLRVAKWGKPKLWVRPASRSSSLRILA